MSDCRIVQQWLWCVLLLMIVDEIREQDATVQRSCDAKMKPMLELLELLANTRLAPVCSAAPAWSCQIKQIKVIDIQQQTVKHE